MKTILFLDKVFLKKKPGVLRGVELFNLHLLRDLLRVGCPVLVAADRSWAEEIRSFAHPYKPELLLLQVLGSEFLNSLAAAFGLWRRKVDVLLLGNVGKGIILLARRLWWMRVFTKCVLIAHREAFPHFVHVFRRFPGHAVCVNEKIAEPFRAAGYSSVQVDYGIFDAERFYPQERKTADAVHFCVLGMLDNAWKGADTAVEAFRLLPAGAQAKCVLHLASFTSPPAFPEKNIIAYAWMPSEKIPEWLRTMDVMLCPSRDEEVMRETFSQAVVQGMLTGLPVIASDRPIFVEKLQQGGGLVFHDAAELARHMETLIGDPGLRARLGRQGRQTAQERYVWNTERFVHRYIEG